MLIKYTKIILFFIIILINFSCEKEKAIHSYGIQKETSFYNRLKKILPTKEFSINENMDTLLFNVGDIKCDKLGNVYVTDMNDFKLKKFDKNGRLISSYGRRGGAPAEFKLQPFKLALDEKNSRIAITLFQAPIIKILDIDFRYITEIMTPEPIVNIAYDDVGNLIVAMPPMRSNLIEPLMIYSKDGKLINSIVPHNLTGNSFFDMFLVNYDKKFKKIILLYAFRNLIQIYDLNGRFDKEFSIPFLPSEADSKKIIDPNMPLIPTGNVFRDISSMNSDGTIYILSGNYAINGNEKEIYDVGIDGKLHYIIPLENEGKILFCANDNSFFISCNDNTCITKYSVQIDGH